MSERITIEVSLVELVAIDRSIHASWLKSEAASSYEVMLWNLLERLREKLGEQT